MKFHHLLSVCALIPWLSSGCGHDNRKPSQKVEQTGEKPSGEEVIVVKNPLNIVRDALVGTWAKPCDREKGMRTALIFKADVFAKTYLVYGDADCSHAKYAIQFGGKYQLNNEDAKAATHEFNGALQFAVLRVYTKEDADSFNANRQFGYTDWDTSTAKNILDMGFVSEILNPNEMKTSMLYSRLAVDGDKFWLADFAVLQNQRPAEMGENDGYLRLK